MWWVQAGVGGGVVIGFWRVFGAIGLMVECLVVDCLVVDGLVVVCLPGDVVVVVGGGLVVARVARVARGWGWVVVARVARGRALEPFDGLRVNFEAGSSFH
ncbi:hypothetical protein, partial [Mycobacterium sp.]|uniref:hypothetical protein n=1 Tax=Mycobacterium sp. TaxID=1785 RepID=UPI003A88A24E